MNMIHSFILAADDDIGKIVFGIIMFIVWGLGAIGSVLEKKRKERKRREELERLTQPQPPIRTQAPAPQRQPGTRTQPASTRPLPTPPPRLVTPPPQRKPAKQRKPVPPPPLPAAPAEEPIVLKPAAVSIETAAPPMQRANQQQAASVSARAVASWMKPQTLRSQFILTEILQPPLALREPREL